ncbi:DUF1329 domain-containing protein [Noviherbaspirillum saxi]|uniref:DUF1329 domain-containing protein n=1 Tax=Noviherbaspirillum saxi TaxID=2320863 RepID=A0A3A3FED6_9BURK|nr:DUF1329 domain-containing protein [Noviherbaspirillum saxi]RJF91706.1 DUF1329 domain-containing protein [Noviherbaspirillum saxi]
MYHAKHFMVIAASALMAGHVYAAPTPEEAKQLGTTLTPIGAEKAGNKDSTIPAWDGGLCKTPAGYNPTRGSAGGTPFVDPFASDKPLYRITQANYNQYADKLDEGTKELFKRYSTMAIDVYPTRRSVCYPDWVYENTVKRVMNPKLVGSAPGLAGAHAQIPFPIPKSGYEVMWNANTKYEPVHMTGHIDAGLMDASGTYTRTSFQTIENWTPYWDNTLTSLPEDKPFWALIASNKYPASQAGGKQLRYQFLRPDLKDSMAWSYVPGQRRVRLAPEFKYDTVSTTSGGILIFDEINGFDGKMDKFDFKLIGKKEMYVPYNAYKFQNASLEETMKKNHANPDIYRWELHRTWVVEATLKQGERHVQQKKVFYVDEDSWIPVIYYSVDHAGKPHHLMHLAVWQQYDWPGPRGGNYVLYDLNRGIYGNQSKPWGPGAENTGWFKVPARATNYFTPDSLAGSGVR